FSLVLSYWCFAAPRALPSFPTRRSSDLDVFWRTAGPLRTHPRTDHLDLEAARAVGEESVRCRRDEPQVGVVERRRPLHLQARAVAAELPQSGLEAVADVAAVGAAGGVDLADLLAPQGERRLVGRETEDGRDLARADRIAPGGSLCCAKHRAPPRFFDVPGRRRRRRAGRRLPGDRRAG